MIDGSGRMQAPRQTRRRRLEGLAGMAAGVVGIVALAGLPPPALAHGEVVDTDPRAGESLLEAPERLTLTFTERIDGQRAEIGLRDERGNAVGELGDAMLDAPGTTVTVELPPLDSGVYTVEYRVLSAVDGHTTGGSFAFLVDPSGTIPPPAPETTSATPAADASAVAARWAALVGTLAAFGTTLFWIRLGRGTGSRAALDAQRVDLRFPWLLVAALAATSLVGLGAYLALAARPLAAETGAGISLDVAAPFGWTPFGVAMRTGLAALLAAVVLGGWRAAVGRGGATAAAREAPFAWVAACLLAAALLGMSLAAHAAAIGGPAFAALDWVHLLAAGAWLGPLPAFAAVGIRANRAGVAVATALHAALAGHARLALVAAPLVALTGIANSPLVAGDARGIVGSGYGNLLLAKALLFAVAIGIGAVNHLLVRRRPGALGGPFRGRLGPLLAVELVVAALAVLAAATMVTVQPASSRQPTVATSAIGSAHLFGETGDTSVHVAVNLPSPGEQRYQVALSDPVTGRPADGAEVALTFHPPRESGLQPGRVELSPQQPGLYGTIGEHTPLVGGWRIEVSLLGVGPAEATITFDLQVSEPMPAQTLQPPDTGIGVPGPLAAAWPLLPDGPLAWLPALVLLAAGSGLLVAGVAARRHGDRPPPVVAWAAGGALVLGIAAGAVAGSRTMVELANAVPEPVASLENPMSPTGESVERGRRIYLANCSGCHGVDGDGDGPIAGELAARPRSLADSMRGLGDGELAYRVTTGLVGTPMPAFGPILSENDRWDLINYLRDRWAEHR